MRRMTPAISALPRLLLASLLVAAASPALALYKVVAPDGSITYTDRPPAAANTRVTNFGRDGGTAPEAEPVLPLELRQTATRYPVTLYTAADCTPCDAARQLLQQRGVPYLERTVSNNDDAAALERLSGGRSVPALTIGTQALRGLSPGDWAAYLDAAGYPRESRLPRQWTQPPATPLVRRAPAPRNAEAEAAASPTPSAVLPVDPAPNALRF